MRALRSKKDPSPFGDNIAALLKYLEDYSYDIPVDIGEKVSVPQDFERNLDPKPKRDGNIDLNDIIQNSDLYHLLRGDTIAPSDPSALDIRQWIDSKRRGL